MIQTCHSGRTDTADKTGKNAANSSVSSSAGRGAFRWIALTMLVILPACAAKGPFGEEWQVRERRLGPYPAEPLYVEVAENLARVAYVVLEGAKHSLYIDGEKGPRFDEIVEDSLQFSPNGRHVACIGRIGDKYFVVVDGRAGPAYSQVGEESFRFSPDGERYAFAARKGDRWHVVIDGNEGPAFDEIGYVREEPNRTVEFDGRPQFSPDGRRVAYAARRGQGMYAVVDGKLSRRYDEVGFPVFSPDGNRVAFGAWRDGNAFVVVDGTEKPAGEWSHESPLFSPDGKRLAWIATKGEGKATRYAVFLDGVKSPEYDDVRYWRFSPNSKRFAYSAERADKYFVVVDGQEGPKYDWIGITDCFRRLEHSPLFSADSLHVAYVATESREDAEEGSVEHVVLDGKPGPSFAEVRRVAFSPKGTLTYEVYQEGKYSIVVNGRIDGGWDATSVSDDDMWDTKGNPVTYSRGGNHVAYVAERENRWYVMLDGREIGKHHFAHNPMFSHDGKRIAYIAYDEGLDEFAVIDGRRGPTFEGFWWPFALDGDNAAYAAERNDGWVIVVNHRPGPRYDYIISTPQFRPNGALVFLAVKDNGVYRVTISPGHAKRRPSRTLPHQ